MVEPLVNPGMFQSQDILWLFNDADIAVVTFLTSADKAGVRVGNIKAGGAQGNLPFYRGNGVS